MYMRVYETLFLLFFRMHELIYKILYEWMYEILLLFHFFSSENARDFIFSFLKGRMNALDSICYVWMRIYETLFFYFCYESVCISASDSVHEISFVIYVWIRMHVQMYQTLWKCTYERN